MSIQSMQSNFVRIIGGKYKGRKISILPNSNIRPTPDRVRETLFNWLMHDIVNLRCLDLFTGSGAISIEALSRNAAFVCTNDNNLENIRHLEKVFNTLKIPADDFKFVNHDTLWLLENQPSDLKLQPFDLVFLDPPFNQGYLEKCLEAILAHNWLNLSLINHTPLIYFEVEHNLNINNIIESLNTKFLNTILDVIKLKTAGMVCYGLIKVFNNANKL